MAGSEGVDGKVRKNVEIGDADSITWAGASPDENEVEDRSNCAVSEEIVHLVQNVLRTPTPAGFE